MTAVAQASTLPVGSPRLVDGVTAASVVASGAGAFAVGLFVVLSEARLFVSPSLYPPAGGLSGRTTLAVLLWLVAWAFLHVRWKRRTLRAGRVLAFTMGLATLGALGTFPPLWWLF